MREINTFDVFGALTAEQLLDVIAGKTVTVILQNGREITVNATANNTKKTKKKGANK